MSFRPEDYPGDYPDEWYETYVGKIVGHVSLLRDMVNPEPLDDQIDPDEFRNAIPKIFFSIGSWDTGVWVDGVTGGRGVVLGLHEDGDMPYILLGDFREYEQLVDDPDESADIRRADIVHIPLDTIGYILGAHAEPQFWRDDE